MITNREAILLAQLKAAVQGSPIAQRDLAALLDRLDREERLAIEAEHELWEHYVAEARAHIASAKARGEPTPALLPHPDDIVIELGRPVRFVGPITPQDQERLNEHIAIREALIWQAGLDRRFDPKGENAPVRERRVSSEVFVLVLNGSLPPRLRMDQDWLGYKIDLASRHAQRVLLKTARAKWYAAGVRVRRGTLFPELWQTLDRYDTLYRIGIEILKEIREKDDQ